MHPAQAGRHVTQLAIGKIPADQDIRIPDLAAEAIAIGAEAGPDAVADAGMARLGRRKTVGIDLEDRPERGFILDQNIERPRERIGNGICAAIGVAPF
jgi:hypothetical protein